MSFSISWDNLLDQLDELSESSTLITPLSHERFRIKEVQQQLSSINNLLQKSVIEKSSSEQ